MVNFDIQQTYNVITNKHELKQNDKPNLLCFSSLPVSLLIPALRGGPVSNLYIYSQEFFKFFFLLLFYGAGVSQKIEVDFPIQLKDISVITTSQ